MCAGFIFVYLCVNRRDYKVAYNVTELCFTAKTWGGKENYITAHEQGKNRNKNTLWCSMSTVELEITQQFGFEIQIVPE